MKANQSNRRLMRGNPLLRERIHDPYRATVKPREATRCPDCGVTFRNGRWAWPRTTQRGLRALRCPACQRIADHYPAGELLLAGNFLAAHRNEILATACHVEEIERVEHPLHRVMAIEDHENGVRITTTDIHLPHQMAHALKKAFSGEMKTHYDREGYFIRVQWERSD